MSTKRIRWYILFWRRTFESRAGLLHWSDFPSFLSSPLPSAGWVWLHSITIIYTQKNLHEDLEEGVKSKKMMKSREEEESWFRWKELPILFFSAHEREHKGDAYKEVDLWERKGKLSLEMRNPEEKIISKEDLENVGRKEELREGTEKRERSLMKRRRYKQLKDCNGIIVEEGRDCNGMMEWGGEEKRKRHLMRRGFSLNTDQKCSLFLRRWWSSRKKNENNPVPLHQVVMSSRHSLKEGKR